MEYAVLVMTDRSALTAPGIWPDSYSSASRTSTRIAPVCEHVMLDTQYRMVDEIGTMVSDLFYQGKLKNGRNETRNRSIVWIDYLPSHNWPDQITLKEGKPDLRNDNEIEITLALLKKLDRSASDGTTVHPIGKIVLYDQLSFPIGYKFTSK